jgi:hypothetical protein
MVAVLKKVARQRQTITALQISFTTFLDFALAV